MGDGMGEREEGDITQSAESGKLTTTFSMVKNYMNSSIDWNYEWVEILMKIVSAL